MGGTKTWLGLHSKKGREGVLVPWAEMWVGPLIMQARGEMCGVSMLGSSGDPDTCVHWAIDDVIGTCFGSSKYPICGRHSGLTRGPELDWCSCVITVCVH